MISSKACRSIAAAVITLIGALAIDSSPVAAVANSITLSASAATIAPGAQTTLVAGMPVVGAGTVSQEIVQRINPTKVRLTSVSNIQYPTGWSLSFSTDGTTFTSTTPANAAGWAAVRAVKASGNVNSQGSEGGFQIATGTATGGTSSLSPGSLTSSGTGDGFQVFFDATRSRVFNVYHHMALGNQLDCHVIATGAVCAGFPFNPQIGSTGQYATGRVVGTKIWIPIYTQVSPVTSSTASFRCVDISAVLANGGNPTLCSTSNVVMATGDLSAAYSYSDARYTAFQMIDGVPTSGSATEGKLWGVIARTGNLVCLDTALAAPCAGMPTNGWSNAVKGTQFNTSNDGVNASIVKWGDNIYIKGSTSNSSVGRLVISCVLASDPTQPCAGFTSAGKDLGVVSYARKVGRLVLLPNSLGVVQGACLLGDTRSLAERPSTVQPVKSANGVPCWDSTGTSFMGPASLSNIVTDTFSFGFSEYQFPIQKGSRIYWGNGVNFTGGADYPPRALCWDAAVNSGNGGLCANLPAGTSTVAPGYVVDNYTVVPDPEIDNCIWIGRDSQPNILTVDISNNVLGCAGAAPVRANFAGTTVVPRMACSSSSTPVRAWKSINITNPAPSANFSAVLTIRATNGSYVNGWQRVPITAGTPLDLSTLDPVVTGATPSFLVDFTVTSGSVSTATATVQAVGDAPELCITPTAQAVCPAGSGPLSGLSGTSTDISAEGSATDAQSNVTTMSPSSTTVAITAPTNAQCGATLSGTATITGTSTPVANATVTLLDSSGNPVLDGQGNAITTTTASDGTYSFGYLFAGNYTVRFSDAGTKTANTATVVTGGSGTTNRLPATVCTSGTTALVEDPNGSPLLNQIVTADMLDRTSPANLVTNGDFTPQPLDSAGNAISGTDIIINSANGRRMPGWTHSGGGSLTYARWYGSGANATNGASGGNFYFGNQSGWSTSPAYDPSTAYSAGGVTQNSYTFTPGYAGYGDNSSPVKISQVIPTVPGTTYRFQFWQASEFWGTTGGIAAFELTGYNRTYFKVNKTGWARYTFDFVATSNSTTLGIMSWGHVAGYDELRLDDVIINRCGAADTTANSGLVTVLVGTNAVVNAAYNTPALATADTSTGAQGAAQTINVKSNDLPSTGNNLTTPTINFCSTDSPASGCTLTTKTVVGEGVYTLSGGNVVFTPCSAANTPAGASCTAAFTGTATLVAYKITDSAGSSATSTITPTVVPAPVASADTSTGAYNTAQTKNILTNDTAGAGATMSTSTVRLCNPTTTPAQTPNNCTVAAGTTINVPNVGAYVVNASGVVTFTPLATFSGTAPALKYQVQDSVGQYTNSTFTPTVTPPPPPTAVADKSSGIQGATQTGNLLSNDSVSGVGQSLTTSTTRLCSAGQTAPTCTATTMSVTGEGNYSLNTSTGVVTFTPCSAANTPAGASCTGPFVGTATPVPYQVSSNTSQTATSTYTPTVVPPPTATADTGTAGWDVNQTFTPTVNDSAGSGATLNAVPLGICTAATAVASCTGTTLTVANQGTYTLNTTTGVITFDPLPTFTGPATAIRYAISDSLNQKTSSTITPTVTPPPAPTATPQQKLVLPGGTATFTSLTGAGGLASTGGPAFTTSATCLVNTSVIPNTCGTSLTIANEGTYTLNTTTGVVSFVALNNATSGVNTPITYKVTDATGQTATSTLTPIIPPPPTAVNDTSYGEQNNSQIINILGNDTASQYAQLSASTVKLCPTNATSPYSATNCNLTTVTVSNQGKYTLNADGTVTFVPCTAAGVAACPASTIFNGSATPIRYIVGDSLGQLTNATINPIVLPPPATMAAPDTGSAAFGQPVVFNPLTNDSAGTLTGLLGYTSVGNASLVPTSVRLCGSGEVAANCTATSITTPSGTYTVNTSTGSITFVPAANFTGTPPTVPSYMVCNQMSGTWAPLTPSTSCATSSVTPTIAPPGAPAASNDTSSGAYNTPQTINVITNDSTDPLLSLVPSTVKLCGVGQTVPNCSLTTLTVPGEGTYEVNATTGVVTFTPLPTFRGTVATAPTYQISDSFGGTASATITPTVAPPVAPTATPETKSVLQGATVNFTNVIGGSALASGVGLQSGAQSGPCIVDPSDSVCKTTFSVTGEGTWSIDQLSGIAQFDADPAAPAGAMTPITYRVTDIVGQTTTALLTPVLPPPSTPTNDTSINALDVNQVINVASNDTPGQGASFTPSTVKLCGAGQVAPFCTQTTLTVANEGTYTVNANGTVTFDPLPTFVGAATPIDYQIFDSLGRAYAASITPRVTTTPPTANPDALTMQAGATASFKPIFGNGALATAANGGPTLINNSVCIVDPSNNTCGNTVTIAEQGTFTLNQSTGVVTYTAVQNATAGAKTPVSYRITDADGFVVEAVLTPTVTVPAVTPTPSNSSANVTPSPAPVAPQPKPSPSNSNNNTSTNVVDSAAQAVNRVNWTRPSTPVFFNPSYLATPSTNAKFNTSLTKLYVAAERRWSVQVTTNDGTWVVIGNNVRFTPADGFLGKAVVKFQLVDTAGKLAHATLTAVVTGNPPILPATGNNANVLTVWAMFMLIFGMALLALRRSVRLKNR